MHAVVLLARGTGTRARDDPAVEGSGPGAARVESARRWVPLGQVHPPGGDEAARRAKFDFPPVDKEKGFSILDVLGTIAAVHGVTVPQVALAWILANDAVTTVIIGARKIAQLDDNLKSVDLTLSADDLKALAEVSAVTPEYPAWMDALGSDRRPGERRY